MISRLQIQFCDMNAEKVNKIVSFLMRFNTFLTFLHKNFTSSNILTFIPPTDWELLLVNL
jgi:hypothetical protein